MFHLSLKKDRYSHTIRANSHCTGFSKTLCQRQPRLQAKTLTRVPFLTGLNEPAGEDGEVGRRNKKHSTQAAPLILPSGLSPQTQPSLAAPSPGPIRPPEPVAPRREIHTDPPGPRTYTHSPVTTWSRQHPQSRSPGGGGRSKAESLLEKT